jgi:hypothetical protein
MTVILFLTSVLPHAPSSLSRKELLSVGSTQSWPFELSLIIFLIDSHPGTPPFEPTTEDMAFADDVPPLWVSEEAELISGPAMGGRSALLTLDGDVIIDDPDSEVESRTVTPDPVTGLAYDRPLDESSIYGSYE